MPNILNKIKAIKNEVKQNIFLHKPFEKKDEEVANEVKAITKKEICLDTINNLINECMQIRDKGNSVEAELQLKSLIKSIGFQRLYFEYLLLLMRNNQEDHTIEILDVLAYFKTISNYGENFTGSNIFACISILTSINHGTQLPLKLIRIEDLELEELRFFCLLLIFRVESIDEAKLLAAKLKGALAIHGYLDIHKYCQNDTCFRHIADKILKSYIPVNSNSVFKRICTMVDDKALDSIGVYMLDVIYNLFPKEYLKISPNFSNMALPLPDLSDSSINFTQIKQFVRFGGDLIVDKKISKSWQNSSLPSYIGSYQECYENSNNFKAKCLIRDRIVASSGQSSEAYSCIQEPRGAIYVGIFGQVRAIKVFKTMAESLRDLSVYTSLHTWDEARPKVPNNVKELLNDHVYEEDKDYVYQLINKSNVDNSLEFDQVVLGKSLCLKSLFENDRKLAEHIKLHTYNEKTLNLIKDAFRVDNNLPIHIFNQIKMIFLINKTLEDFISNDNCSHILMLRPDLAIKLKEIKLILEDLCQINEYQNQFLCDTEYTCMRVKLGGIGDRLIGLNKKSAQKIHQQINQYLHPVFQFYTGEIKFEQIKLEISKNIPDFDALGAHHFLGSLFYKAGLVEKHITTEFKIDRDKYQLSVVKSLIQQLKSNG